MILVWVVAEWVDLSTCRHAKAELLSPHAREPNILALYAPLLPFDSFQVPGMQESRLTRMRPTFDPRTALVASVT